MADGEANIFGAWENARSEKTREHSDGQCAGQRGSDAEQQSNGHSDR